MWIVGAALVVLLLLSRGSSSSASSGVSESDAAQLQQSALDSQTSVALGAQGVTNNQTAASLAAVQAQVSGSNYQAAVSANTALAGAEAGDIFSYGVQALNASNVATQTTAALAASLASTTSNQVVQTQTIQAASLAHTQDTNAQLTALGMTLDENNAEATMNNNLQTLVANQNYSLGQGTLANSAASIADNFSLGTNNLDITSANLPLLLQAQENIAASNASAAQATAQANANLTNAKATATNVSTATSAATSLLGSSGSSGGILGSIGSAVSDLFDF